MAILRPVIFGVLLFTLPLTAHGQGVPKTLAEYLPRLKGEGPILALNAGSVRSDGKRNDLAAYGRQRTKVGDLIALVPTEMVVVDDSFGNLGSLTEGLPSQIKMLYLLQSLTAEQWKRITGAGIGLGDLQGEQRAVFQSLLPERLGWRAYRLKKDGMDAEEVGKGEVSDKERDGVKIRIFRDLAFDLNLASETRAFTTHDTNLYRGKPGDVFLEREGQFEEGDAFGLKVRQSVPNVAKPSALKYDAREFDALVAVPKNASLREVLAALGPEIYADLRVADAKVTFTGDRARTGDLLKALALAVTGTYRRVGSAYVLTSDTVGLGTRKLRFSLWWEDMQSRAHRLGSEWRRKVGERMEGAAFDRGSPFAPNASMQAHLSVQDATPNQDWISSNDLSAPVRDYLNLINRHYPHQRVDTSKARITTQFRFGFVLPDGRTLRPEIQSLGTRTEFGPRVGTPERPPTEGPAVSLPIPQETPRLRLAVRADTTALAKSAAELAAGRGFQELWIETENPAALAAAVEAGKKHGLPIRLLIRPWGAKTVDPDRNLLGDTGGQLAPHLGSLDLAKEIQRTLRLEPLEGYDRMAPADPGRAKAWGNYVSLAGTPGLAGVVVSSLHAMGYEAPSDRLFFYGNSRALQEARKFGYSEAQRLAFLRKHGMDPIDVVPQGLMAGPDLRQPFFLDDGLRGSTTIYDGRDVPHPGTASIRQEWARFRNEGFGSATLKLLNEMGAVTSVIVSPLPSPEMNLPRGDEALVYWDQNSPLPFINRERVPALILVALPPTPTRDQLYNLNWYVKRDEVRAAIDLRRVPSGAWASLIDRVLAKPGK